MRTSFVTLALVVGAVSPVVSLPSPSLADPALVRPSSPDAPIDDAGKKAAVQGLAQLLRQHYVFPDAGERYARELSQRLAAGRYRATTTAAAFAEALNGDLQAIRKDGHLRVRFDPGFQPRDHDAEPSAAERTRYHQRAAAQGFGVERVERLAGNIGVIDLRGFHSLELAAPSLSAAMTLVAGTDALIIDLRQNGGGDPETVAFLCSYLFSDARPVHINDIYDRVKNETQQYWTRSALPGPRYVGKPVYLLTSPRTFSAAEEFSYDLKNLKRATLIGETTGGGAHPGEVNAIGAGFIAFIPTGRAINPITHTDWEGTGVKPDVAAPAAEALQVAHLAALRALVKDEPDGDRRASLERAIGDVEKTARPAPLPAHP